MKKTTSYLFSIVILLGTLSTKAQETTENNAPDIFRTYYLSSRFEEQIKNQLDIDPFVFRVKNNKLLEQIGNEIESKIGLSNITFDTLDLYVMEMLKDYDTKWNLEPEPIESYEVSFIQFKGSPNPSPQQQRTPNGPCVNTDFETGDATGWELFRGKVNNQPFIMTNINPTTLAGSQHSMHQAPGVDPVAGFPKVNPNGGGQYSIRIGDGTGTSKKAASIKQTFLVDQSNAIFSYSYALVLEDPSSHSLGQKPFFKINMYDQNGNPINCGEYEVIADPNADPDFLPFYSTNSWNAGSIEGFYLPWRTTFAPLDSYIGQNVTIEVIVGDCSLGGHYGYGYFEASCNPMELIQTTNGICGNATLSAPAGAAAYLWSNGATTESISVSNTGIYSCVITPVTGSACSITLSDTVTISSSVPVAGFISSNDSICLGDPLSFTDQSSVTLPANIISWDWDFGDGNTVSSQNTNHTYTQPGTYDVSLTVSSGINCVDSITQTVTVSPYPNISITPAGPFCESAPAETITVNSGDGVWTASCSTCLDPTTGIFTPSSAGPGNHWLYYTVNHPCFGADSIEVIVLPDADASFQMPTQFCESDASFMATTSFSGGIFSSTCGNCISNIGEFSPTIAGPGNHAISYIMNGQCGDTTNITVAVTGIIDPVITPIGPFCDSEFSSQLTVDVPGGSWSSNCGSCLDTTNQIFSPLISGSGVYQIVYTPSGTCAVSDTINIDVYQQADASFLLDTFFCENSSPVNINTIQTGGTLSSTCGTCLDPSGIFTPSLAGPGNHEVIYEISGMCGDADTIMVAIDTFVNAQINYSSPLCTNSSPINLTVSANGGVWQSNCANCLDSQTGIFDPSLAGAGIHEISYILGNTCSNSDTIQIQVDQTYNSDFTIIDSVCIDEGVVTIQFVESGGILTSSCNGCTSLPGSFDPLVAGAGEHFIFYEFTGMCGDLDSTSIIVLDRPDASILAVSDFCPNDTPLNITSVETGGIWSGNGITSSADGTFSPQASGPGNHWVYYEIDSYCPALDSIQILVHDSLEILISEDTSFCIGGSTSIGVTPSNGTGNYNYNWSNGNTQALQFISPFQTNNYSVVVDDGCTTLIDSVLVTVHPIPVFSFSTDTTEGCVPLTIEFNHTPPDSNSICSWDFGDGNLSNTCGTVYNTYQLEGCYTITLTVESENGCSFTEVFTDLICAHDWTEADFSYTHLGENYLEPYVQFNNNSSSNSEYFLWEFGYSNEFGTSQEENPFVNFVGASIDDYEVCLHTNNSNNCPDDTCQIINFEELSTIYVPNTFTPDQDGINDFFIPVINGMEGETELLIFNRWGELLLHEKSSSPKWDGTYKNTDCKQDVYIWKIRTKNNSGETIEKIGHVNLIK